MKEGGANLRWPVEGLACCCMLGELSTVSQCEQVAEFLHEAQVASEQTGDVVRAHVLAVACHICLTCSQCRAEVERHRWAYKEADQREHELRQQLYKILELISGHDPPETVERQERPHSPPTVEMSTPERGPPGPVERLSLWQRFQVLLGRRLPPPSPESESPGVSAEALSPLPVRKKEEQSPPSLAVYCLGPFRVYQDDQPVADWPSNKGKCIFRYLVTHRGTPIARDILMDVLWPDAVPDAARRNLHQAIYSLRQVLQQGHPDFPHIQFENNCYLLNPAMGLWLDFVEFEKHVQAGQRFEASRRFAEAVAEYGTAEALYQGDFLEEDLYEDWPRVQREHIRNMYFDLANRLSGYYVQQGEYHAAIALCQKILAQDNCYEEAHRRLMRCHLAQGQRHLAVRQYQTCVEALREELDLTPSGETVALYRHITGIA